MAIKKNYVNGEWVESVTKRIRNVINPATGEVLAHVTDSNKTDVANAVAAAKKSFYETREWRDMSAQDRSDLLLEVCREIKQRSNEISRLDTLDSGKPLREAEGDIDDAYHCLQYYAGLIKMPYGGVYDVNDGFGKTHAYTVKEPIGVCAQITPWNYPFLMAMWKIAPALAAGNSIVFKPSEETPLSVIELFAIFDKVGLPKGTANLVLGTGEDVGQYLSSSLDVDMITFTGSTAVGQKIQRAASGNIKKVGLELGGKSPNIIFADADFEGAIEWAMIGIFFNQGEVCSAGSRMIIEKSLKDRFVKRLAERANRITIGNGLDNPDMGPLISERQMNKVLHYIELGKKEGATLVCGGKRCLKNNCRRGFFVEPTIFDDCMADMSIVKDEIFGPVVTIQTFESEEEAIRLANGTRYGLAGAVFTKDGARALRVIKELRAGITWINAYNPTYNEAPWGGYKMSGVGRELGVYGLDEYRETKQININLNPGPVGWYTH
ncbi:MAG: aldehyde dehydrogenase family protein [Sporolactobacillus sp.]|jgi:betaine-aldehyde dehydrogenase|nr:aldehyde dehydrogenase family protein [Sporolactobacillus sp.]